jgi:hypothetical protein
MTAAELVDKLLASEHADVLRDSVAWLVAELMEAEVGALTGAELGERALTGATPSAMATGHAAGTPGSASSSWPSPSCGLGRTSQAFWSRAGAASRRWSRWCRRPMSTGSPPARSTGWWSNSGCAA